MTDKLQKIREEVEKLKSQLIRGACSSQIAMETGCKEEAYNEVLAILDSMQEKPSEIKSKCMYTNDNYTGEDRKILCDGCEEDCKYNKKETVSEIDFEQELYKAFGRVNDFTLGMQIAKRFYEMGRNHQEPVSEEWIKELRTKLDSLLKEDFEKVWGKYGAEEKEKPVNNDFEMALAEMIDKAQTSVVEPLVIAAQWKDELIKLAKSEEPVSEDLGEYINELSKQFPEVSFAKLSRIAVRVAKWQKQQDQSTIELAEDHAMLAGMEKMKEQMMASGTDVTVHIEAGNYPYIPQIELYDYDKDIPLAKEGDRYKVILIKED